MNHPRRSPREKLRRNSPRTNGTISFWSEPSKLIRFLLLGVAALSGDIERNPPKEHTTPTQPEAPTIFKLGDWTFHFDQNFPKALKNRIIKLWQNSYPYIESLLGVTRITTGDWKALHIEVTSLQGGYQSDEERTIAIADTTTDALNIHEFSHMFQGPDSPEMNWIREGIAVAVSNMVAPKVEVARWDQNCPLPSLGKNFRKYLGKHPFARYDDHRMGLQIRYFYAGTFWEEVEREKPGSIRRFMDALRLAYADRGKEAMEMYLMDPEALLEEFLGAVPTAFQKYRALFLQNAISGKFIDIVYAARIRRGDKKHLYVSAVRRLENTVESPLPGRRGVARIWNPETNMESAIPFISGTDGIEIDVTEMEKYIGKTQVYFAVIEVDGCMPEEISFSLDDR